MVASDVCNLLHRCQLRAGHRGPCRDLEEIWDRLDELQGALKISGDGMRLIAERLTTAAQAAGAIVNETGGMQ